MRCGCGCGEETKPATQARAGYAKGDPQRFVRGHGNRGRKQTPEAIERRRLSNLGLKRSAEARANISAGLKAKGIRPSREASARGARGKFGDKANGWKGGRVFRNGRACLYMPEHPRASGLYVYEHIVVAEKKLGRPLLPGEVVHHIDLDQSNNDPANLIVLPSQAEHLRLHKQLGHVR